MQVSLKNFNNLMLKSKTVKKSFKSIQHPISYLPGTGRRGKGASEQRVDLPHAWHFMGSSFIKAQP